MQNPGKVWTLVLGSALALPTGALAQVNTPHTGTYIGLGSDLMASVTANLEQDGDDFYDNETQSVGMEGTFTSGEVLFGHGVQLGGLFGAVEAHYTFGGLEDTLAAGFNDVEALEGNLSSGYGISARAGFFPGTDDVIIYGRFGYAARELELSAIDGVRKWDESKDFGGLRLGLGIEYRPTQLELPLFVRIEAVRTAYNAEDLSIRTKDADLDAEVDGLVEQRSQISVGFTFDLMGLGNRGGGL